MDLIFFIFSELLRRRALESLWHFRDIGRPFETHDSLTSSWSLLSYPISPVTWFHYYEVLRDFVNDLTRATGHLYIHGSVTLPLRVVSSRLVQMAVYSMFLFNTPYNVSQCYTRIRFRLFFLSTTAVGDMITIDNVEYRTRYSDPFYYDIAGMNSSYWEI